MPTQWVEPDEFLKHAGQTVYHIYKNDDASQPSREYWYSLSQFGSDDDSHGENGTFDVRELPQAKGMDCESAGGRIEIICRALDDGHFADWNWDDKDGETNTNEE